MNLNIVTQALNGEVIVTDPLREREFKRARKQISDGIHGGAVWRCISPHAVGNSKPLEVELWFDIRVDSAAMERQVAQIVADAKLVRAR